MVHGVAGGSSGSISSMLTESIMNNPLIHDCRSEADYVSVEHFPLDLDIPIVSAVVDPNALSDAERCTPRQSRLRAALMYKSFLGYLDTLTASAEVTAFGAIAALRAVDEAGEQDGVFADLEAVDPSSVPEEQHESHPALQAFRGLLTLINSRDVRAILAADTILELMANNPTKSVAFARDIAGAVKDAIAFNPADHHMFIRPGLVDFEELALRFGRIASFYAGPALRNAPDSLVVPERHRLRSELMDTLAFNGYGPYFELTSSEGANEGLAGLPSQVQSFDQGYRAFLDHCSEAGVGLEWSEVADLPLYDSTCGAVFGALAANYREAFLSDEEAFYNRADDTIAMLGNVPSRIATLATTSVLVTERALDAFDAGLAAYAADVEVPEALWNNAVVMRDPIAGAPSDVMMGYWGSSEHLARIETALDRSAQADVKSRLFFALGPATWREILSASPAEPGLARGVHLPSTASAESGRPLVSVGGWSDPHPTLVLRALGEETCDDIAYVTKRGGEGAFARLVQANLGAASLASALYDTDDRDSAVQRSLATADHIHCTTWDATSALEAASVFRDAYLEFDAVRPGDGTTIEACSTK